MQHDNSGIRRRHQDTGTFNAGRNVEKRAARAAEAVARRSALQAHAAGDLTANTAKIRRTVLMTNLLANRRLRQRARDGWGRAS